MYIKNSTTQALEEYKTIIIRNKASLVRRDTMEGREYIVVPMVMMVEGVHNGSQGPIYYPAEELAKLPGVWNHKPVVVYHPDGPTACDPDVLSTYKIGVIMNAKIDNKRLVAEAWLEESRIMEVDDRVMDAINNEQAMELSIGVYVEREEAEGVWNSEQYVAIARNLRPDHLAVLPDKRGACSMADGAGFIRNEFTSKISGDITHCLEARVMDLALPYIENEASFDAKRFAVMKALQAKYNTTGLNDAMVWVEDMYDAFVIYEQEGKLFKADYTFSEGSNEVTFTGEPILVTRHTEYRTPDGTFVGNNAGQYNKPKPNQNNMDKDKLIDSLISNKATKWTEEDREVLTNMDVSVLEKLAPVVNDSPAPQAPRQEKPDTKPAATAPTNNVGPQDQPETLETYLGKAPAEMRAVLNEMHSTYHRERNNLIAAIVKNSGGVYTAEKLQGMEMNALRDINQIILNAKPPAPQPQPSVFNYAGQAPVPVVTENADDEPLELPSMTW